MSHYFNRIADWAGSLPALVRYAACILLLFACLPSFFTPWWADAVYVKRAFPNQVVRLMQIGRAGDYKPDYETQEADRALFGDPRILEAIVCIKDDSGSFKQHRVGMKWLSAREWTRSVVGVSWPFSKNCVGREWMAMKDGSQCSAIYFSETVNPQNGRPFEIQLKVDIGSSPN